MNIKSEKNIQKKKQKTWSLNIGTAADWQQTEPGIETPALVSGPQGPLATNPGTQVELALPVGPSRGVVGVTYNHLTLLPGL